MGDDRFITISVTSENVTVYAWTDDNITFVGKDIPGSYWYFNDSLIAEINGSNWLSINSTISSQIDAIASEDFTNSLLTLNHIRPFHTGIYTLQDDAATNYSIYMTVYEANLSSAVLVLRNASDLCKAYLSIVDSVIPSDLEIYRTVNSPALTLTSADQSNETYFEIINSSLHITDNTTDTDLNVQYTMAINNFSTDIYNSITFVKSIHEPNITKLGTPNNCTIFIYHNYNKNVECIRNIRCCLTSSNMSTECNDTTNLDHMEFEYTSNFTSIDLFIEYDLIYGNYSFNINITPCIDDVIPGVETTTMNPSTSQFETSDAFTDDDTTPGDMTNYTENASSTYTGTVTIPLITASSEYLDTSTLRITTTTIPDKVPGGLAGWKIALIVIGSVLGVLLLVGVIVLIIWKKKSRQTLPSDIPMQIRHATSEQIVQKPVPKTKPIVRQPTVSSRTSSASSEQSDRQHKYDRIRQASSSRRSPPPTARQQRHRHQRQDSDDDNDFQSKRSQPSSSQVNERQQRHRHQRQDSNDGNEFQSKRSQPPSQLTDRQQRRRQRRQHSNDDDNFQPKISQPASTSHNHSSHQQHRQKQRRSQVSDSEQYYYPSGSQLIPVPVDPVYQHQVPRGRRRPLPPISYD
ncbi:unnamed protein product [Adineta steineri]|uniref:Uncharacterized protein n=1 Tax=Adineta steineri TaxID=433720 RepID=A0A818R8P7_9BILA|nr:unnamed protein product [Adineta steineri]CAF3648761.1 unnamed protein product [Adineta steineri]